VKQRTVLYLIRSWAFGGSHTILLSLMKHLPIDQYRIICVPYDTFSGSDEIFIDQARKRGLPPSEDRIPWKSRGNWWKARATIVELIKKYNADIVHTHDPQSNTIVGIGRGAFPCATVASPYGWWDGLVPFRRFVYQWIEREFALPHFDRVITVSNHMKARILKGPTPESIIRVIYTGLEPTLSPAQSSLRARVGIPEDAVVVGTISRVSVEKGHTHLIDAMARLAQSHPKLRLLIVGDGPAKQDLQLQTDRLSLTNVVKFAGFCDDLAEAHAAMDIFAQPSTQQEGLPTSVLEAQSAGLPVVASDIGGVNESLQHGVTGVLVPPGDAVALASALANMADDTAQRNAMGAAGRARIASLFTMDRMVREVAQTYEEAIAQYAARKKNTP